MFQVLSPMAFVAVNDNNEMEAEVGRDDWLERPCQYSSQKQLMTKKICWESCWKLRHEKSQDLVMSLLAVAVVPAELSIDFIAGSKAEVHPADVTDPVRSANVPDPETMSRDQPNSREKCVISEQQILLFIKILSQKMTQDS